MLSLKTAQTFNAAAFVLQNKILNENGNPVEFQKHKFLIQPYMDNSPKQAIIKASQVGWSTLAIIRSLHLAQFVRANVIYTLPSKSIVKDFVTPKVDPLIENNPVLKSLVGDVDSMGLKSIGDRFVYFRSSWDEASGIAISAHILINDELDRSNPKAIRTYRTRLDAAKIDRPDLGWQWQFSNPSIPGAGVDAYWQKSDQKHWFIKCSRCNLQQYLTFPENINFQTKQYICKHCERPLTPEDRNNGQWVNKYFNREISGYWLSQMMVPWIPADKIIDDSEGDQEVFYNFTLGLPYVTKDTQMSKEALIRCISPDTNPRTQVGMGVDVGVIKHYVIGNKYGIFRVGQTESWQEIENLRNQYGAFMVIDGNPYPTPVKKLVTKYRGKVFAHYYNQDKKNLGIVRWGEKEDYGTVESDRTKVIDSVVADLNNQDILFNMTQTELENEDYFSHWTNMFRIITVTAKGLRVPEWTHIEGRPDHFGHATVYQQIALLKTLTAGGVVRPQAASEQVIEKNPLVINNQVSALNIDELVRRANMPQPKDWKHN